MIVNTGAEPNGAPTIALTGRNFVMKALVAFALLLAIDAPAQAKLTPGDRVAAAQPVSADDAVMSSGPIGAMLESDYFQAPRSKFGGGGSCRLYLYFSDRRLTQSCE
jgi:hypothetical protein